MGSGGALFAYKGGVVFKDMTQSNYGVCTIIVITPPILMKICTVLHYYCEN